MYGPSGSVAYAFAVAVSLATNTLLATRQLAGSAARPLRSQPSTYFGQWLFTHAGIRKLAEIGSHPRAAASVTPLENGATTVTTIGGCGRCRGFAMNPCPIPGMKWRSTDTFQNRPASP